MKISVIQLNSQANVAENLACTLDAMTLAVDTDNPDLITFTAMTGERDWETLLRARAAETSVVRSTGASTTESI